MRAVLFFLRKIWAFAGSKLYMNIAGMVAVSLLEGIGILLLVPMLKAGGIGGFQSGSTPLSPLSSQLSPEMILPVILLIFVLVMLGQVYFKRFVTLQNMRISQEFDLMMKKETYQKILDAEWSFFLKKRKSDLISSMTSEIGRVNGGVTLSLQVLVSVIFTMIQIGISFWLSVPLTISILISGSLIFLFSRKFLRRARGLGSQSTQSARALLAGVSDQLSGVKEIKSNQLEASRLQWLDKATRKIHQEQLEFFRLKTSTQLLFQVFSALLIAGLVYASVQLFHTTLEQLLLILVVFSRLWPRFSGLQSSLEQIASYYPAYVSLEELRNQCDEAKELTTEFVRDSGLTFNDSLECRKVSYRYEKDSRAYTLQDINIKIPVNCMTAIIGKSGAGKSTLVDLLMGLLHPDEGELLLDGVSLSQKDLVKMRQLIGYVPQDPFLFNDSLRGNLLLVKPDACEEELWKALEFASVDQFVRALPDGLDTQIGDRGIRLSGGERQRIVLARAMLRAPAILVLDEATSSLDTENETKIQEAIARLQGHITLIIIAHRLSTIREADQVLVVDEGRIVQSGKFGELEREKKSLFNQMLQNQGYETTPIAYKSSI
ncbi:ABC transporter ATP-binding protein [Paenibacillus herberti]|uniref:Multidrug ABC transporter n=1 Tax=Paenibacillus herberti TaxID=1619309 RepID=A0A229NV12_9BACL|nr:ABC transporter ATP-binding protein [Paenibacillus herberti]OXM13712.1 multidrug ABC transporter [Paenibacillus herberti]